MAVSRVHLFVDNSNIFISAKDVAEKREGRAARGQVRIQFNHLIGLALAGRELGKAFVVGSVPPEQEEVWRQLERATGVAPELYERGKFSGGEQGLDQCLQVHMLRAMSDHADNPQIAVLMTGDGAGYDDGVGFHADMERMHKSGWGIEVVSWNDHCRRALRDWADKNGVFVALDEYYGSVTFLERVRTASPLDLSSRQLSVPRKPPARVAEERARDERAGEIARLEAELAALRSAAAVKAAGKARHDRRFAKNGGAK